MNTHDPKRTYVGEAQGTILAAKKQTGDEGDYLDQIVLLDNGKYYWKRINLFEMSHRRKHVTKKWAMMLMKKWKESPEQ